MGRGAASTGHRMSRVLAQFQWLPWQGQPTASIPFIRLHLSAPISVLSTFHLHGQVDDQRLPGSILNWHLHIISCHGRTSPRRRNFIAFFLIFVLAPFLTRQGCCHFTVDVGDTPGLADLSGPSPDACGSLTRCGASASHWGASEICATAASQIGYVPDRRVQWSGASASPSVIVWGLSHHLAARMGAGE